MDCVPFLDPNFREFVDHEVVEINNLILEYINFKRQASQIDNTEFSYICIFISKSNFSAEMIMAINHELYDDGNYCSTALEQKESTIIVTFRFFIPHAFDNPTRSQYKLQSFFYYP